MSKYLQAVEKLKNLYCPFCSGLGYSNLDDGTPVFCDECNGTGFDGELLPEITIGKLIVWRDAEEPIKQNLVSIDPVNKGYLKVFQTGKSSSDDILKLQAIHREEHRKPLTETEIEEMRILLVQAGIIGEDDDFAEHYRKLPPQPIEVPLKDLSGIREILATQRNKIREERKKEMRDMLEDVDN